VKTLEIQVQDLRCKFDDKCRECESYIAISQHRLEQYNELMNKKKELEDAR